MSRPYASYICMQDEVYFLDVSGKQEKIELFFEYLEMKCPLVIGVHEAPMPLV